MKDQTFTLQCEMNYFDVATSYEVAAAHGHDFQNIFRSSPMEHSDLISQLKTDSWSSCNTKHILIPEGSSSQNTLSFDDLSLPGNREKIYEDVMKSQGIHKNQNHSSNRVIAAAKLPSLAKDHVIAERKRRKKFSQRLIALSAMIPGLKKMDKATVLGDAIKYLKELQERVNSLEAQSAMKTTEIHCENNKGASTKILDEIEKLHPIVVNSSVIPFGMSAVNITIVAQIHEKFCIAVKDLVKNLWSLFSQSM
ncbi:hypothetical protein GIB67_033810 [Kingdonia uniflora]|uniref:BHLH domain-containing protein n=1 Tax=Kingdonia uniflora TaxID=39325 RepID=A0A7J7LIB2_9MAGN|nr:hypothetical protein GIB67_033810 [Kingdonia uniflora]